MYLFHMPSQGEVKAECGLAFSARHQVQLSDDNWNRPKNVLLGRWSETRLVFIETCLRWKPALCGNNRQDGRLTGRENQTIAHTSGRGKDLFCSRAPSRASQDPCASCSRSGRPGTGKDFDEQQL